MAMRPLPDRRTAALAALALVLLALAATWTGLANDWVQDDIPVILRNDALHTMATPWRVFTTAYWPKPFAPDLYRPLTSLLLALEWGAGGGRPLLFKVASILLYVAATLAAWRLARRVLSEGAAWCVAALFAVHPVHVEAVAVAVNQAELLVATILALVVAAYIDRERAGTSPTARWVAGILGTYVLAVLVKEHALVLPALLVAAEVTVLDRGVALRDRLRRHRALLVGFPVAVVLLVVVRRLVLGSARGSFVAEGLSHSGIGGRALTMLSVVPEWGRLLAWPAHLQADYSPREIVAATGIDSPQLVGILLLFLAVVLFFKTRRSRPAIAFGIAWLAVALGPVHNVLVPTGIVLAERTLFLASIGFLLAGVGLLEVGREQLARTRPGLARMTVASGMLALLVMGATRSASRQRVWHDIGTLWHQSVIDAPYSYRAHHAYAQVLWEAKSYRTAEWHYRAAIALWPDAWTISLELADKYRLDGLCEPAIPLYQSVLAADPKRVEGRGSLVACFLYLGRYAEAARIAREGIPLGLEVPRLERLAATADSAAMVGAPPRSVRLPREPSDTTRR